MAANKFATMLSRNTHKITLILVYVVLEWFLIFFLLLNSLFSYLIVKFANYFGLKTPCLWCSRIDHVFEPGKEHASYRDLICENHASEISKLGYCSNHRKLVEAQDMCEECSSSRPNCHGKSIDIRKRIAFFSWVKDMDIDVISTHGEKNIENGEKVLRCSCCDSSLSSKFYSPYLLFQPSWGVLDYAQKGNLSTDATGEEHDGGEYSDPCKSDSQTDRCCDDEHEMERNRGEGEEDDGGLEDEHRVPSDVEEGVETREEEAEVGCLMSPSSIRIKEMVTDEDDKVGDVEGTEQELSEEENSNISAEGTNAVFRSSDDIVFEVCRREDASLEIIPLRLESINDVNDRCLLPVELIGSATSENQTFNSCKKEDQNKHVHQEGVLDSEIPVETQFESAEAEEDIVVEATVELLADEGKEKTNSLEIESTEMAENDNSSTLYTDECNGDLGGDASEEVAITQATRTLSDEAYSFEVIEVKESVDLPAPKEAGSKILDDENNSEILTGMEVFDQEFNNQTRAHELPHGNNTESSTTSESAANDKDSKQSEEATIEGRTLSADRTEQGINHHLSLSSELNEMEEEKAPETPSYVDGLHQIHKKLLLLEKRESGTEESLDGSVISDFEAGEGVLTVDRMKSVLKAERKALNALYAELEEERSASAIAANQTMAMITRLQEEKAAMQMEALQYQRMMEEQSEYDQEALQLLNELMVKREKEKQDLEKELEVYRKKVLEYEAKEKRRMRQSKNSSGRSRASSASSSNAEDSDDLSIDLHHEIVDEDSFHSHQEISIYTPTDAVLNLEVEGLECAKHLSTLDESLAEFEEERISIIEQLKVLEEKLFTLGDDEEQLLEDVKPLEHLAEENGEEFNGFSNGFSEGFDAKYYQERRNLGGKAKNLLPLFDAIDMEDEDVVVNEEQEGSDSVVLQNSSSASKLALEKKKHAIEEEVDHVYERLQALEADREFLKHCISSLKKGDKGMDLLQEILQHLRDLRTVELRVRNMGDGVLA